MTIGTRISKLRKSKGFTQEFLAEQLGVSRQAVSKWESGQSQPSTENLLRLSAVLNVTLSDIVAIQDNDMTSMEQYAYRRLQQDQKIEEFSKQALKIATQVGLIILYYGLMYGSCYFFDCVFGQRIYVFAWMDMNHSIQITCVIAAVLALLKLPSACIGLCSGTKIGITLGQIVGLYNDMTSNVGLSNDWIAYLGAVLAFGFIGLLFDQSLAAGFRWNRLRKIIAGSLVCVILLFYTHFAASHARKVYGANCGYDAGYQLGQHDAAMGYEMNDSHQGVIPEPDFALGDSAYHGYMQYWYRGYCDGYYGISNPG